MSTVAVRKSGTTVDPRLVLLLVAVVIAAIVIAVVLVVRARSGSSLNLTGNWVAQQGVVKVDLTLSGTNDNLTGNLKAENSPIPIQGTVNAQVTGDKALVHVHALGQTLTAHCTVSNTKMVCTGTGGNTTLTLTFTRP